MSGWGFFRSGPSFASPWEMEDAPLELYRTHEQQDRPELLARGIAMFNDPGYQPQYWLPQTMGQQQWHRDEDGYFRRFDSSAQTYIDAVMSSPMAPPPRGGATTMLPTIRAPRRVDEFQQAAIDLMQRGITRYDPGPEPEPHYALGHGIPGPQLLPEDFGALDSYEESAVSAAERYKGASVRQCIDEIRAQDAALWALMRRR